LSDPAKTPGLDETGFVQAFLTSGQFEGGIEVSQLNSGIGMGMSMEVDEKSHSELTNRRVTGRFDEGVMFLPGLLRKGIALGGFVDLTVGVEFGSMQVADYEMKAAAGSFLELHRNEAGEVLCVGISGGDSATAIGNLRGSQTAVMGCRDDQRQVSG